MSIDNFQSINDLVTKTANQINLSFFGRQQAIGSVLLEKNQFIYDPSKHIIMIGGKEMEGVTSAIIKKTQPLVKTYDGVSSDDVCFSLIGSTTYNITITLQQTSPSVDLLKKLCLFMVYNGGGYADLVVIENDFQGYSSPVVCVNYPDMNVTSEAKDVVFEFMSFSN